MHGLWSTTKSEGVALIIRAISFEDFRRRLCGPDSPTSQMDRQTDGRHAIAIPRFGLQSIAR